MDSYVQMFIDNEIYSAKVTIKSYLNSAVNTIKETLNTTQLGMSDKTYFGHFLNMHKLQFSGQVVYYMLWSICPTTSGRFRDTYFGGRKFPLHNHDIVKVFSTTMCEDDNDMVKLALLYFLETVILSKEKPTRYYWRVDMLDDIEYFLTYLWGTLSYDATVKSMHGYLGKRSNASHTYNITGFLIAFMLGEGDDQCFDEVRGEDVGVGDAHRTCDQRTDHTANHLIPHVSISSSPFAESEQSVKVFTQMSDRKLAGGRRKRENYRVHTIAHCGKMICILPMSGSVTFDPYRLVSDEVARLYAHFMDTSVDDQTVELFWITEGKDYFRDMECSSKWLTSDHIETVAQLIRQHADKYPEVFDDRILLLDNRLSQYMEARLNFFNENKENYNFGEEMLEFLNGKESMMNSKPCTAYD
ncbi:hypothetical protein FNV43_RR04482 [Rhamnella rubrinervis]|uniref:DUF1985 domain-containing protein n=1 Tax=Rhamnella rubrinervis TaxID=2594499 RepID=A0A8K0HJL9_9ROSA|nr:hypothetical protein FNV43_RR04482 [Rhamnella rubrinervis]